MRCFEILYCAFIAVSVTFLGAAQSTPSVLQALAEGAGGTSDCSDAEAARCLFKAWYPDMHVTHGYDPTNKDVAETYGELEPEGIEEVLDRVSEFGAPLSGDDVFADLGSGIGQVALLVFLKTFVKQVVGIELVRERHELALRGRENALQALSALEGNSAVSADDRELLLLQGDITDTALYSQWAAASVVFTCSILFPKELMSDLHDAFLANLEPGTLIFSLNNLGDNPDHQSIAPLATYHTKTSWTQNGPGAKVFVYIRNLKPILLKDLNLAIAKSKSVLEECITWGMSSQSFLTDKVVQRFCTVFAMKWGERARYGHPRLDYDWVVPEL